MDAANVSEKRGIHITDAFNESRYYDLLEQGRLLVLVFRNSSIKWDKKKKTKFFENKLQKRNV